MRKLTATLSLTLAVLFGSAGVGESAVPYNGPCVKGDYYRHSAAFGQCSDAYESGDYETALSEWTPLAKRGNAGAQYNLGLLYDNGHGVPQNLEPVVNWWRLTVKQGHSLSQSALGFSYEIEEYVLSPPQSYRPNKCPEPGLFKCGTEPGPCFT